MKTAIKAGVLIIKSETEQETTELKIWIQQNTNCQNDNILFEFV